MVEKTFDPNWDEQRIAFLFSLYVQFRDALPPFVSLTKDERMSRQTIGENRWTYAYKAEEIAKDYTDDIGLKPAELAQIKELAFNFKHLMHFRRVIDKLSISLRDTSMFVGANFFEAAKIVHQSVRLADLKGMPGMRALLDELDKLYANQGRSDSGDANDTDPQDGSPTDGGGGNSGPA